MQDATFGLDSVEKLIRVFSSQNKQNYLSEEKVSMEMETDHVAEPDVAVNKFKNVISLLDRTRQELAVLVLEEPL